MLVHIMKMLMQFLMLPVLQPFAKQYRRMWIFVYETYMTILIILDHEYLIISIIFLTIQCLMSFTLLLAMCHQNVFKCVLFHIQECLMSRFIESKLKFPMSFLYNRVNIHHARNIFTDLYFLRALERVNP